MKVKYKILIIGIVVISLVSFLLSSSIDGQPRCWGSDCDVWNNIDWIYGTIMEEDVYHCHQLGFVWNSTSNSCKTSSTPFGSMPKDRGFLIEFQAWWNDLFNDNYPLELDRILDVCFNGADTDLIERNWRNSTHGIDNINCTFTFVSESTESSTYVYIPSDITKANPNLNGPDGSASLDTYNPSDVKNRITNTVIGKVLSVDDPIEWKNEFNQSSGAVPVTIKVKENIKGTTDGKKLTFYLHGHYFGDEFYLAPYEAQFEIGEKVLVHLAPAVKFEFQNGTALYPILGENGKYKIGDDDKAYNKNHKQGKSLDSAKKESK